MTEENLTTSERDSEESDRADTAPGEFAAATEPAVDQAQGPGLGEEGAHVSRGEDPRVGDPKPALLKLIDLATKYPEIGPVVAELAFKLGYAYLGDRIVRMGLDSEQGPGLEYYFVMAQAARRQRDFAQARKHAIEAIEAFQRTVDADLGAEDAERMLHLVRLGYSTLLFDEKNVHGDRDYVEALQQRLPELAQRLGDSAFYHTLVAQTRWFDDAQASEAAWDKAASLDTTESTWNARGTWYKDAVGDSDKAEQAYRKGLEVAPTSALLQHNLGQLLVDKAERGDVDVEQARKALNEAEPLLRGALREDSPKGFRRHVHGTIDRLLALRSSLPPRGQRAREVQAPAQREPRVGEVFTGTVVKLKPFGAFVALPQCGTGLLHNSEMAQWPVHNPSDVLSVGQRVQVKVLEVSGQDGKLRVRLSMKALQQGVQHGAQHGVQNSAGQLASQPTDEVQAYGAPLPPAAQVAGSFDEPFELFERAPVQTLPSSNSQPSQPSKQGNQSRQGPSNQQAARSPRPSNGSPPSQHGRHHGGDRRREPYRDQGRDHGRDQWQGRQGGSRGSRQRDELHDKLASLGEMLLAKIQKTDKPDK